MPQLREPLAGRFCGQYRINLFGTAFSPDRIKSGIVEHIIRRMP